MKYLIKLYTLLKPGVKVENSIKICETGTGILKFAYEIVLCSVAHCE